MSTPLEPGGALDIQSYVFAPQPGRRVRPASQVSQRTRQREAAGYLRANPNATRQQAMRATAAQRRRGYLPTTIRAERATPEQTARAQQYQQRAERTRQRFIVTGPSWSFDDYGKISVHPDDLAHMPMDVLRAMSDTQGSLFADYIDAERGPGYANRQNMQAERDTWTREEHIFYLTHSFEERRMYLYDYYQRVGVQGVSSSPDDEMILKGRYH